MTALALPITAAEARTLADEREAADERSASLTAQVRTIAAAKVDALASTLGLTMIAVAAAEPSMLAPNARVALTIPRQGMTVAISDVAHDQIAARLAIPRDYYQRMLTTQPELLSANVNQWFHSEPDERLLRMMRPITNEDGMLLAATGAQFKLRAMLGKSYRTIDDAELVAAVLPLMAERGAMLREFSLTDTRLHAKWTTEVTSVQAIRERVSASTGVALADVGRHGTVNGRDVSWVDEIIRSGAYLRHSEIGFAALEVAGFIDILKCLNGMVIPAGVRVRHVGKRRELDGFEDMAYLSDGTQQLENAALMSRVQDALIATLDEKRQADFGTTLLGAKATTVDRDTTEPLFAFVGHLGAAIGMTESERELLKEETAHSIAVEGAPTHFAFVQGVTAVARQIGDYDRRIEYEREGWKLLTDGPAKLVTLAREGAAKLARTERGEARIEYANSVRATRATRGASARERTAR